MTAAASLFLLLTSRARVIARTARFAIVDEVHAVAGTKRARAAVRKPLSKA